LILSLLHRFVTKLSLEELSLKLLNTVLQLGSQRWVKAIHKILFKEINSLDAWLAVLSICGVKQQDNFAPHLGFSENVRK